MTMGDAMRITPLDIQQMVFRVSFRGFKETKAVAKPSLSLGSVRRNLRERGPEATVGFKTSWPMRTPNFARRAGSMAVSRAGNFPPLVMSIRIGDPGAMWF